MRTNSVTSLYPGRARLAWLALLVTASCGRCGAPAAKDAAELLPAQWTYALSTGPLGQLATRLGATSQLAAQIPGGEALGDNARALSTQLGFDLTTREGILQSGLDPERGAAVTLLEAGAGNKPAWIAAFPLSSEGTFAQHLETTLAGRAGYPVRTDEPRANLHCVVFSRTGATGRIAYAIIHGYGVVTFSADPAALLAEAVARAPEKSLAADPRLIHARTELDHPDVLLLSTSANPLLARLIGRLPPGDSAIGISLLPDGAQVRVTQDLPEAHRAEVRSLLAPPERDAFQTPLGPLEVRVNAAPAKLPALLAQVPFLREPLANLRAAFVKNGADLDRDLFGALSPGAALSIELSPSANLGRALDPSAMDLRNHSPFDVIHLYAVAAARDPEAVRKGFTALALALPAVGITAVRSAEKKSASGGMLDEWSTTYPGGEGVRFGIFVPGRDLCGQSAPARTQALVYAIGGVGSLENVLASRLNCAPASLSEAVRTKAPSQLLDGGHTAPLEAVSEPLVQLQLDLGALASSIAKLPDTAYGSGPQVFVARSLVSQIVVPMQRLRASAEVRPAERGVAASLRLRVMSPPANGTPQ
jgi:hypothetical protein